MSEHPKECAWHVDQYPWECTCGLVYRQHRDRIEQLTAEVERLRGALQFYARENSWRSCGMYMSGRPNPSSAEIDRGDKARAALGERHDQ